MSKIEFTSLGTAEVARITKKAALVEFGGDMDRQWIPFSVMSTPTAAQYEEGAQIENFRVETWFAEKME